MLSELCKGLGAACLIGCSTFAWATTADEIKQKLESNDAQAAYELGRAHPELLGDATFDFYFGIAALNAGSPGEGVLALERYVARYPDNPAGRFHLGRGYFIIGEDLRAREELENLYQQAGEEERAVIQQYLDAIWVRESRYRPAATAYLEGGIGYDSNINGGIDSGPVAGLPGFEILPGTTQEKESDTQALWAAGVQGSLPVAPNWAVYGGVHVNGKLNLGDSNDQFDQQQSTLQAGTSYQDGRHLYRGGVEWQSIRLDAQRYLDIGSLVGGWQFRPDQFQLFGVTAAVSELDYRNIDIYAYKDKSAPPQSSRSDVRDGRLGSLAFNWAWAPSLPWAPLWNNQLSVGAERNSDNRDDLSRNFWGFKTALTARPAPDWLVGAELGYQRSHYRDIYGLDLPRREDDLWSLGLSASYRLSRDWTVLGEYLHLRQDSNIGLHDYTRNLVSAKLRYEYR